MKKLYEKSEIGFAVAWIVAYVVLTSVADNLSKGIGVAKCVTLPVHLLLCAALLGFVYKNRLCEKYGFRRPFYPASRFLYYLPLAVVALSKLAGGVGLPMTPVETALFVLSMTCVGLLEEVIFRGLLFRAMEKDNVHRAIVVSAVTFGLGHIVNAFNGSGRSLPETLVQILFAVAVGFALVLVFHRGGSLVPCILFHAVNNALGAFAAEGGFAPWVEMLVNGGIILLIAAYCLWLAKSLPEPKPTEGRG